MMDDEKPQLPTLPEIPSDNKKTIVISQKVLDSNIKENIFSDDDEDKTEKEQDDEKQTTLFGGNKDLVVHSFF